MCNNTECPIKDECYRAMATPNEYSQSVSNFECIIIDKDVYCDYYIPLKK